MIYHYTSIETLSKILESKKIRFNNLKDVDDIFESELFLKKSLAQLIFVSCWTKDNKENLLLWELYTQGRGIRIGLPNYPWKKIDLRSWKNQDCFRLFGLDNNIKYIIPFEFHDVFGENHTILPPFFIPDQMGVFEKEVIYLEETLLKEKYNHLYQIEYINSSFNMSIKPLEFGLYKNELWSQQNEFRFVLFIAPIKIDFNNHEQYTSELYDYIEREKESNLKDFYLSLDPTVFNNMELMLGYNCTKQDEENLYQILKDNKLNIRVSKSEIKKRK